MLLKYYVTVFMSVLPLSDIDECNLTTDNVCGNGVCKNIPGDFICVCNEGYRTMAPMQICMGNYQKKCMPSNNQSQFLFSFFAQ